MYLLFRMGWNRNNCLSLKFKNSNKILTIASLEKKKKTEYLIVLGPSFLPGKELIAATIWRQDLCLPCSHWPYLLAKSFQFWSSVSFSHHISVNFICLCYLFSPCKLWVYKPIYKACHSISHFEYYFMLVYFWELYEWEWSWRLSSCPQVAFCLLRILKYWQRA